MAEGGWFGWKDVWRKEKKVGGGSHHKLSTKKCMEVGHVGQHNWSYCPCDRLCC